MASLIDNYEQQYAVLTADITAKIGKIRTQNDEKRQLIQDVDRQIEEAQELLEQMELEVRGVNSSSRDRLRGRVESHRAELKRLTQEFQLAKKPRDDSSIEITREDSWENSITEDQKKRLLDTSERIDRTGRTLQNGYRMVLETEEIGSEVLKELHVQRETIQRGRTKLRETDAELGRGSRLLSGMIFRSLQQRFVLAAVALTLIIVACIVMYYSLKS
ncbi:vesicle transport through interaction with t-SNAREs homolog 1A [Ceratina calcarata]|uniref:Vesicle transport through interaction with t-SNAREs homolog 1A n=1 Tax=Ceratina calcarata TaxID=156304 RepID=A0AAJ7NFG1_9HYME|nr:vesicle transport through interaction with t-SNAREs homolog 1A [Ceratina calcarata]